MKIKLFILIGRTYIAAFLIVNLFNIIPINFSNNSWFVAVSMLFVDTASLLLIGLASLKYVSYSSMMKNSENQQNDQVNGVQKYKNNLNSINRYSLYFMFLYCFIALFQIFVVLNGSRQLDLLYSASIEKFENIYQAEDNTDRFPSDMTDGNINNSQSSIPGIQDKKEEFFNQLTLNKNSAMSFLIKDSIKIFLMSIIWVYGFFKLAKFK